MEEEWHDTLQMPTEFLWLMEFVSETDDGDYVAQAIRDGNAVAVSDGSFKLAIGIVFHWDMRRPSMWIGQQLLM
jgi:hypothetical protein